MARMYFIGDGYKILACEALESSARRRCTELTETMHLEPGVLHVYECDPTEIVLDDETEAGRPVWAYPAEYAAARASGYDMPTLDEVIAREAPGVHLRHVASSREQTGGQSCISDDYEGTVRGKHFSVKIRPDATPHFYDDELDDDERQEVLAAIDGHLSQVDAELRDDDELDQRAIPGHVFDDAFSAGFESGQKVPARTGNSTQAWSDFRAQNERGEIAHGEHPEVAAEYVRGHLEGQEERD